MIIQLGEWQVEDLGMAQEEIAASSRTPLIIHVKAFQPQRPWIVSYAESRTSNELHLPRLRPVKLKVMSGDGVIHALPGPKLGPGVSAIPNIDSETTWMARELGSQRLPCIEYCGQFHSQCGLTVVVQEEKDFDSWLAGLGGELNQK